MQTVSVVFSTLHCEGYIADLRYRWLITFGSARWLIEILTAILKSTRHGGQSTERCIAFGGTTRSPAKFMSENLRVNIWRDNFTSDYVRVNLPSRNLSRNMKVIHIECTLGTRGFSCAVSGVGYVSIVTRATFSYFLIKNALLYHFLANWLAHNKMTDKSVFGEPWSPELKSQSFPVSFFWCRGFVPHRKWNLTLLAHQNTGKENHYRKFFFCYTYQHIGEV